MIPRWKKDVWMHPEPECDCEDAREHYQKEKDFEQAVADEALETARELRQFNGE